jgi:arylsulfatase A-like enzyme
VPAAVLALRATAPGNSSPKPPRGGRGTRGAVESSPVARRWLDSPVPYFALAALLLAAAIASQFQLRIPSRHVEPVEKLLELRKRGDLNVVFVLIDTLRADRLGIYGYSRDTSRVIDEAATYGIVFDDVVSQSSWTKTSMASLWTATNPIRNGILRYNHVIPDRAVLPAEIFRDAGYRTVGLWRNGWVESNFGFAQGFETYVRPSIGEERIRIHRESRSPNPLEGTDEDLTIAALDFLQRFGSQRFFLYLHYMDVHQYVYDESSAIFGTSYSDIYDQAIHWVDSLVGVLLDRLERMKLLERTIVVIAADHGEAFLEHGREGHAQDLHGEVTHVPLIILPPFLLDPGVRVKTTVSNADLWPTVLDLVGLPPLPGADGRSLVPMILAAGGAGDATDAAVRERPVFAQLVRGWGRPKLEHPASLVSVTDHGMRLFTVLPGDAPFELYDRAADPGERKNLAHAEPAASERLLGLVKGYAADAQAPWGSPAPEIVLDDLRLNQLRALGYVVERSKP